jgi:hypothetical protein
MLENYTTLRFSPPPNLSEITYSVNETHRGMASSAVGITTGYRLDDQETGVRFPVRARILSSPYPDKFWSLQNNLSQGCQDIFPRGKAAEA